MAKTRKRGRPKKKQQKLPIEIVGLALILLSFFAIGRFGFVGRFLVNIFRLFVGDTYPLAALIGIGLGFFLLIKGKRPNFKGTKWIGSFLIYTAFLVWFHARLFAPIMNSEINIISATWRFFTGELFSNSISQSLGGGMIGSLLYAVSYFLFSSVGTYLMMILLLFFGIMTFGQFSYKRLLEKVRSGGRSGFQWAKTRTDSSKEKKAKKKLEKNDRKKEEISETEEITGDRPIKEDSDVEIDNDSNGQTALKIEGFQQHEEKKEEEEDDGSLVEFEVSEQENEDYTLPAVSLLNNRESTDQSDEYDVIQQNVKKLEETFESFGVKAKVLKANLGPSVTKYEIEPATGVKVSKIVGLADDLALALAAKDIRMEAPIPGKAMIGIEVPNTEVSMVSFRDIIEGRTKNKGKLLEVPLGRDIAGNVAMADLSKMPHLLIAGATGSGKSVGINGIITSLLLKAKPNEVKLMMIDPKMVELNVYNGIPHLLTPVVTNPKKAAQALQKVVQEMERRYELFAASGTRNMEGYNEFVKKENREKEEEKAVLPLPYIVVIVDELADLMMVASNEVEDAIIRLAQMARAAGIHMILATQRPSVDVITGIIKANVPSRIAFAVSSGTDSRTILDSNGAEKLLGRGDMLFQPMGDNKPSRVQGAFISDEEVEAIVDFVKNQQEANYVEEMIPKDEPKTSQGEAEDEYYDDAVALVTDMQTASISLLQRRFRIGYNRAARIVDEMEMRGVVGPSEGSKPREVLISSEPDSLTEQEE